MSKKILYTTVIFAWMFLLSSCERDKDFILPGPKLNTLFESQNSFVQEPGNDVILEFELEATSGIQSFEVFRNDAIFETADEFVGEISANYLFDYEIPTDEDIGTTTSFSVLLIDAEGREAGYDFNIVSGSTFTETVENINGTEVIRVKGRVNGDYSFLEQNTYVVDSTFSIENNGNLTIEAGSTVYFKTYPDETTSRLVITRGSTINAVGTAENPIVFTSDKLLTGDTPQADDWGGLFIYGNAPTNQGSVILEDGFRYGGSATNESSGTLSYIRVEHAGKSGLHGIHLFGVGAGTQVNHIQVFNNENIAFRLKGGGVNLKYISAIKHGGYGLWAEHGWQGYGQFWIFQTDRQATLVPVNFWNQARSIEFRNDEAFFLTEPRTEFVVSNVTLIGNGDAEGTENGTRRGVRIRRGAFGIFQNAIVTEFPDDAVRVEDLDVEELGNEMILDNVHAFNNRVNYNEDAESFFFNSGNFNLSEQPVPGINIDNFVGSLPSSFNPTSVSSWFENAPYIGAVENAGSDWTAEGNWFKNLDGTIR